MDTFPTTNIFEIAMTPSPAQDSVHQYLEQIIGEPVEKTDHAIDGAAGQTDNIFVLTGTVKLLELWIDVTAVGNSTTFSGVKFEIFPTAGVQIDITGVIDGSGCLAGAQFVKTSDESTALTFVDNTLGAVVEGAAGPPPQAGLFVPTIIAKKSGAVTNVRLVFTGDGATDITATIHARWYPLSADGNLVSA